MGHMVYTVHAPWVAKISGFHVLVVNRYVFFTCRRNNLERTFVSDCSLPSLDFCIVIFQLFHCRLGLSGRAHPHANPHLLVLEGQETLTIREYVPGRRVLRWKQG